MNEALVAPRPKKKTRWLLAFAALLLLVGGGWLSLMLTASGGGDAHRLVMPGAAGFGVAGAIPVEVAAGSAKDGMAVRYLLTSASVNQVAFIRREHYAVKINVSAGTVGVAKDSLTYVILGRNGDKLSEGKVTLQSSLDAGESGEGEISDAEIQNGRRIVIGKQGE